MLFLKKLFKTVKSDDNLAMVTFLMNCFYFDLHIRPNFQIFLTFAFRLDPSCIVCSTFLLVNILLALPCFCFCFCFLFPFHTSHLFHFTFFTLNNKKLKKLLVEKYRKGKETKKPSEENNEKSEKKIYSTFITTLFFLP